MYKYLHVPNSIKPEKRHNDKFWNNYWNSSYNALAQNPVLKTTPYMLPQNAKKSVTTQYSWYVIKTINNFLILCIIERTRCMSPTYKFWDMQKSIPLHCINMCSAIWIELGIVFWYVYISIIRIHTHLHFYHSQNS